MKRLMFSLITTLSAHPSCLDAVEASHFMATLLSFLARPQHSASSSVPFLDKMNDNNTKDFKLQVPGP